MSVAPPLRLIAAADLVWGVALLARGPQLWSAFGGSPPAEVDRAAITVLGVRRVVQATAQLVAPGLLPRTVIGMEVLHVVTMLPLLRKGSSRRGPAAATAMIALANAVAQKAAHRAGRS